MKKLTLEQANTITVAALAKRTELDALPMTVAVLDDTGQIKALQREDKTPLMRADIATAKAWGSLGMGHSGPAQAGFAENHPILAHGFMNIAKGGMVMAPGGVLIIDDEDDIIGAVGVSGDLPDKDQACAIAGIEAAGLKPFLG